LHDISLRDEVFDVASTTAEIHDLGARSKVSTSWPEVVYTSVGPSPTPVPLAVAAYTTSTTTSTSTSTTTSVLGVEELSYRLRWWTFPNDLYTVRA